MVQVGLFYMKVETDQLIQLRHFENQTKIYCNIKPIQINSLWFGLFLVAHTYKINVHFT